MRLRGRWLGLARALWFSVLSLAAGVFVATFPARHTQLLDIAADSHTALVRFGLTDGDLAVYVMALDVLVFSVYALIAAIIFWRRMEDPAALFVSLTMMLVGAMLPRPSDAVGLADPLLHLPIVLIFALGTISIIGFFGVFPDGQFVPRWSRWLALGWAVGVLVWYFQPLIRTGEQPWPPDMVPYSIVTLGLAVGFVAQVYRFRRVSNPLQRQQTKWVVLGLALAILGVFAFLILLPILSAGVDEPGETRILYILLGVPLFYVSTMMLPISIGLSILRYRLWNIDTIINRALVYGLLTGMLLAFTVGAVVLLQSVFRALAGQESQLAVVISTLASAALFEPLRDRLQTFIDRRFYRHKYDAELALSAFTARVRNEVDLNAIADDLLGFVQETVQPSTVSLWLREPSLSADARRRAADRRPQPYTRRSGP